MRTEIAARDERSAFIIWSEVDVSIKAIKCCFLFDGASARASMEMDLFYSETESLETSFVARTVDAE